MFEVIGRLQHSDGKIRIVIFIGYHREEITVESAAAWARDLLEAAHGTGVYSEDKEPLFPPEPTSGAV